MSETGPGTLIRCVSKWRTRASWSWSSSARIDELVGGIADGAGGPTAPLAPDRFDRRLVEVGKGIGETA